MKEFLLNEIKATGTTTGDVYFPQTKLLLPFDGTNGATTTSDSENNTVTFVATAQISTAQSKFGGSSLLLDGNSDYITVSNSNLGLSGATFTLEFWVYLNGGIGSLTCLYSDYNGGSAGMIINKTTDDILAAYLTGDGADITGTTTLSTGQWYHVALSGSSGSYKLFLNGTQEGSTFTGSATNGTSTKYIGCFYWTNLGGALRFVNGYLDSFRITKGTARYTSAFTPPTSAHLTSAGDVNKQILINSTADGVAIGTGGINQARIAKAWVNFDGSGSITIKNSYNISSITDHAVRHYRVNYSTAMSSADYSIVGSNLGGDQDNYYYNFLCSDASAKTATNCSFKAVHYSAGWSTSYADPDSLSIIVFGN